MKKNIVLIILITLLFPACDFFGLMKNNLEIQLAQLTIEVTTGDRFGTVLPDLPTADSYKINYLSGPESRTAETYAPDKFPLEVSLPLGTWKIKAEALNGGKAFASQTQEITVVQGNNALGFNLVPDFSGNGNASFSVSWPSGTSITSVIGEMTHKTKGTKVPVKFTISGQSATASSTGIEGGDYYLIITLKNAAGNIEALDDGIIRIYTNLTTAANFNFSADYFNGKPLKPLSLTAAASGSKVDLSWTDTSWNETGFIIERKLQTGGTYSVLATVAADSSSYSDTSVAGNTFYNYRIKSSNNVGGSDYASEIEIRSLGQEALITSFTVTDDNNTSQTITFGADKTAAQKVNIANLSSVSPTIAISEKAAVTPASGTAQDFSAGSVTYTVTAENGTVNTYTLTLTGNVVYVTQAGSGTKSGYSWNNASDNLQSAINSASSGDQIWVAAGTYYPTQGAGTGRYFYLKDGVSLYGGFAGTETALSQRNVSSHVSKLSGDFSGDDTYTDGLPSGSMNDNSNHVLFFNGSGSETISVDGFTITGGRGSGSGGAGYIGNLSRIILKNNTFTLNYEWVLTLADFKTADVSGNKFNLNISPSTSLIAVQPSSSGSTANLVTFTDNEFTNNKTISGTVLYYDNKSSNLRLVGNLFQNNLCGGAYGTAFYANMDSSTINVTTFLHRNVFDNNSVIYGIAFSTASPVYITGSGSSTRKLISHSNVITRSNKTYFTASSSSYPATGNGGYWIESISSATLIHDTIVGNYGANVVAVYSQNGTATEVYNGMITDNFKSGAADYFGIGSGGSIKLYNSVIQDNSDPVYNGSNGGINTVTTVNCTNASGDVMQDRLNNPAGSNNSWRDSDDGLQLTNSSTVMNTGQTVVPSESALGYDLNNDGDPYDNYTVLSDILGASRNSGINPEPGAYEAQNNYTNFTTLYVDKDATGSGNGYTWADAYTTLQPALDAAANNASSSRIISVWVAEGTYTPTSWPASWRNGDNNARHFMIKDYIKLYGGFSGTETLLSQRNASSHPVILSGDFGSNDSDSNSDGFEDANRNDNAYHVFYSQGALIPNASLIDSVTIRSGNAFDVNILDMGSNELKGGGFYSPSGAPDFKSVTFEQNRSSAWGGAVHIASHAQSGVDFSSCTFNYNASSSDGGAVYCNSEDLAFDNCSFQKNTGLNGGALYADSMTLAITGNSVFTNNYAGSAKNGGAVYLTSGIIKVKNASFTGNRAMNGTALYLLNLNSVNTASSTLNSLSESTLTSNSISTAGSGGAAVYVQGTFRINKTLFKGNTSSGGNAAILHKQNTGQNDTLYCYNTVFYNNSDTSGNVIISTSLIKMVNFVFYNNTAGRLINLTGGATAGGASANWFQNGTITSNATGSNTMIYNGYGAGSNSGTLVSLLFGPNTAGGNFENFDTTIGVASTSSGSFSNYTSPVSGDSDWFTSSCGLKLNSPEINGASFYSEGGFGSIDVNLDGTPTSSFQTLGDITGTAWSQSQAGAYHTAGALP